MGLLKRFSMIFKPKASKTLEKYEDPRETLDYSYERQLELLQKMRRGVADVATPRKRIELQAQSLQAKVESFRTRKETIKATYTAAEAQTRINEAVSGIGEEMGDVGLAMQRAEDKVALMQSRAGALDELMASGALDNLSMSSDRLQAELDRGSGDAMVEAELSRIRGELGGGTTAKQLGPSQSAPAESGAPAEPSTQQQPESAPAQEEQR